MIDEETIRVGVTDLRRLIAKAEHADSELAVAVEADQKWRRSDELLKAEIRILRYGMIRVLGLPEDTDLDSAELTRALTHHPMAIPVREPSQRHAWPTNTAEPIAAPEDVAPAVFAAALNAITGDQDKPVATIATTDTGRRFQELDRDGEYGPRAFTSGAVQPEDLVLVWEGGAQENIWQRNGDRDQGKWELVDRPHIAMHWSDLLAAAEGGHVIEVIEIKQEQEVAASE